MSKPIYSRCREHRSIKKITAVSKSGREWKDQGVYV